MLNDLKLIELQETEKINTFGGGQAWYWIGQVVRGFVEFGRAVNEGGYTVGKVGYNL